MDEPFISRTLAAAEPSRRRDFTSGFIDITPALLQTTGNDVIIRTPKASYVNLIANLNKKRKRRLTRRSHSAPSVFTDARESSVVYFLFVVLIFLLSSSFKGTTTFKLVDALYFTVVTLCTIGYGDIVPDTTFTKLFTCVFILVGFGFIDILLIGLVTYICDRQEAVLLDESKFNTMMETYMVDKEKGRMRIRTKVCLALIVVVGCLAIGTFAVHFMEELSWVDSFYLSVTSVTTVGYVDYAFETVQGRCFAILWLLISTLAVARAFLHLTELRIDKRNRRIAKWVLQKKITLGDLVAADLDNDGSISKSEFVINKLKEMGRITEKEIQQISNQFDSLDTSNCGKITLADLMESD